MKRELVVFLHRRDLRTLDNLGLNALVEAYPGVPVLHAFVFNPVQIDPEKNPLFNKNCVQFMIESLKDLREQLKGALWLYEGKDSDALKSLMSKHRVSAVGWNSDYTPFARSRDSELESWLREKNVDVITREDYSLFKMGSVLTGSGKPYEVYTPFYKRCLKLRDRIKEPRSVVYRVFDAGRGTVKNVDAYYGETNARLAVRGGRDRALEILRDVERGSFRHYDHQRDFPSLDKTTKLSAYIKFGCVSVREALRAFIKAYGLKGGLARELLWREFYAHATWHFPRVLRGEPHKATPNGFRWTQNKTWRDAAFSAKTGVPIVDAGIRELLATGWMNNRVRMIVASFIVKDLAMDWRAFERELFARYLVDYDPSTNAHSWQGMASVGIDGAPYWRIMNPWRQMARFDPECAYVKAWIPELKGLDAKKILDWRSHASDHAKTQYPKPIVDHDKRIEDYLRRWRGYSKT